MQTWTWTLFSEEEKSLEIYLHFYFRKAVRSLIWGINAYLLANKKQVFPKGVI